MSDLNITTAGELLSPDKPQSIRTGSSTRSASRPRTAATASGSCDR